jgi:hypothetical protein
MLPHNQIKKKETLLIYQHGKFSTSMITQIKPIDIEFIKHATKL